MLGGGNDWGCNGGGDWGCGNMKRVVSVVVGMMCEEEWGSNLCVVV